MPRKFARLTLSVASIPSSITRRTNASRALVSATIGLFESRVAAESLLSKQIADRALSTRRIGNPPQIEAGDSVSTFRDRSFPERLILGRVLAREPQKRRGI